MFNILPTIANWILSASQVLSSASSSPHLDAELILGLATRKSREKLLTGGSESLSMWQLIRASYYLHLRKRMVPVAYITHRKKFFGLNFYVDKNVLIPRPETENLVQMVLDYIRNLDYAPTILDVGCGSGCIGLSLYYTTLDPESQYFLPKKSRLLLSDISSKALKVARKNAKRLKIGGVKFVRSNLLNGIDISNVDIICANLPYVDRKWEFVSKSVKFEPRKAIFAEKNGLEIIEKLLRQIAFLRGGSMRERKKRLAIFLEADPLQMGEIRKLVLELFPGARVRADGFVMRVTV